MKTPLLSEAEFNIHRSNPGGEWLLRKQAIADREMEENRGRKGSHAKGVFGPDTAVIRNVVIPTVSLAVLDGVNDEIPLPGDVKYDRLAASVEENGYTHENEIVLWVNHRGGAWIAEGNNRVALALRKDIPGLRTTIWYFNGGEEVNGPFHPDRVRELTKRYPQEDVMKTRKKPRYGFHVAPSRHDLSITAEGLRPDRQGNIYIWDTEDMARWWARREAKTQGEPMTVWTVDTKGLAVIPDPEAQDMSEWSREFEPGWPGGGWVIQGQDVGPERVDSR